jgi:MoxR-like ATPase
MNWQIFTGTGEPQTATEAWRSIPDPPPWRDRDVAIRRFVITEPLLNAVNTALHLRRPLLLTGNPGSGKSTLVNLIAAELQLGEPLSWHITSRSTLNDALFQYDALARLHATQAEAADYGQGPGRVDDFVTLGPLGTALASPDRPRAVLIDEIDKSDLDLPGDLLNVLEHGEFEIPPLVRDARNNSENAHESTYHVRGADRQVYSISGGVVRRMHIPIIVLTSNGERTFPPPFLRRCVRFEIPRPPESFVWQVVESYLNEAVEDEQATIHDFAQRLIQGEILALDQLLNFVYLVTGEAAPGTEAREQLADILLEELTSK